jgi:hypothetical protein
MNSARIILPDDEGIDFGLARSTGVQKAVGKVGGSGTTAIPDQMRD